MVSIVTGEVGGSCDASQPRFACQLKELLDRECGTGIKRANPTCRWSCLNFGFQIHFVITHGESTYEIHDLDSSVYLPACF